jgi:hypothetical protein
MWEGYPLEPRIEKLTKIGPDRFCRLTENRSVEFEIFKNLRNFEIKILKKLDIILRILVETKFKTLLYFVVENSSKFVRLLKAGKIDLTDSF